MIRHAIKTHIPFTLFNFKFIFQTLKLLCVVNNMYDEWLFFLTLRKKIKLKKIIFSQLKEMVKFLVKENKRQRSLSHPYYHIIYFPLPHEAEENKSVKGHL
jgi:hypothetical protein